MGRTTRKRTLDPPPGAELSEGWSVVKGSATPHHEHLTPDGFSSRKAAEEARRAGGSAAAISSSTATTPPPALRQLQPTHSRTMSPSPVAAAVSTLSLPQSLPQPSRSSFKQEEEVRSALTVAGVQEFHSLGSDQMPPEGYFKWLHAKWDTRLASLLTDGKSRRIDFVIGVPNGFVFLEVDGRLARCVKDETARKRRPQYTAWPAPSPIRVIRWARAWGLARR